MHLVSVEYMLTSKSFIPHLQVHVLTWRCILKGFLLQSPPSASARPINSTTASGTRVGGNRGDLLTSVPLLHQGLSWLCSEKQKQTSAALSSDKSHDVPNTTDGRDDALQSPRVTDVSGHGGGWRARLTCLFMPSSSIQRAVRSGWVRFHAECEWRGFWQSSILHPDKTTTMWWFFCPCGLWWGKENSIIQSNEAKGLWGKWVPSPRAVL